MPTLRWGSTGDDVAKLQQTLAELGFYSGPIDGSFGPLTRSAVMAFQRANGLTPDGIVGPITWSALAGLPTQGNGGPAGTDDPDQPGTPAGGQAISLHIGLNRVNPAKYGGWNGALSGCENDARTMTRIAAAEGFVIRQLFSENATTQNVLNAIQDAADQLGAGGYFLLTYAGHGGQVPNNGTDAEDDKLDETWVLYDRQLLDDEIGQALAAFAPGVSVVTVSDSCHSGTVTREMPEQFQRDFAELKKSFYADLAVIRPGPNEPIAFPRPFAAVQAMTNRATARFPGQRGAVAVLERPILLRDEVVTREMPFDVNLQVNEIQADELAVARDQITVTRADLRANELLLSGCLDAQLSQETGGHGVFTTAVERTWANGSFSGSYTALHKAISALMGPTQTPALTTHGPNPETLLARTPFDS
jgi:peptidoglycan hydrolase-like protein with peptidoglycan-binding domain